MSSSTDSWGIEVGASEIKAIRLQKVQKGAVVVAEHEVIPHKKVLTTPDTNMEEVIRLGLGQFAAKHAMAKCSVVVSVPGHMAFARFAKLPPVEPKRVPDIVKFEAIQQIPFPLDQVEWDYQVFQQPDSPEVEVGIFAITKEKVNAWLSHFEAADIPVHGVTLTPVAALNAIAYDHAFDATTPGTLVMDIGTTTTDLIIYDAGRVWMRTINIGGHHFTESLVKAFKLAYSKAEKLKKEAASSKYARQIFQAMRPVFVDLVSEVQRSMGYYQSLNRESQVKKVIGLGSTFHLPGLQKFLAQQMQLEVHRLDAFKKIAVEGKEAAAFAQHSAVLAPAYGLAIQGLELETVSASLMPKAVLRKVQWKAKNKWMIAAAAVTAVSATIPMTRLMLDKKDYARDEQLRPQIKSIISAAESQKGELSKVGGGEANKDALYNINRVNTYTTLWPMIVQDIHDSIKSVDPEMKFTGKEAADLRKTPRAKREQLFLESFVVDYGYNPGSGAAAGAVGGPSAQPTAAATADPDAGDSVKIWGEYKEDAFAPGFVVPKPKVSEEKGKDGKEAEKPKETKEEAAKPVPAFDVKMTVITPNEKGRALVESKVIEWLRKNTVRPDRPYKIVVTDKWMVRESDVGKEARGGPGGGGPVPASPRRPGGRRGGYGDGGFGPGGLNPGGFGPGGQRPRSGASDKPSTLLSNKPGAPTKPGDNPLVKPDNTADANLKLDYTEFFPQDPLASEDSSKDKRVEIQFRIEIARPEWDLMLAAATAETISTIDKKWKGEPEKKESDKDATDEKKTPDEGSESPKEGDKPAAPAAGKPEAAKPAATKPESPKAETKPAADPANDAEETP